jgi:hypothetical protein
MFEIIDPTVTVTGRPISQWIGDVTRQNVIELAERGAGGGYVWSVPQVNGNGTSAPSPLSSHPDYYYSIPFLILSPSYQTELTVEFEVIIAGGIDVALWCEGSASSVTTGITTGTHTLTVTLPPRPANGDLRCALLFKSQVGALLDSGAITYATNREMRSTTNVLTGSQKGTHLFIDLTATGTPVRGWQGTARYHAMRGERRTGGGNHDDFETWPSPDDSLQTAVAYSASVDVYQLGTMSLISLQARLETAALTGLPQPTEHYAGQPVRGTWLQRIARYLRGVYMTAPQYAWIGGVGGYNRTTGTSPASSVSPYRFWGAWIPRQTTDILSTAIRARTGVDGVVISILYTCVSPVEIAIEFDGTPVASIVLPAAPSGAQKRNAAEDSGTLSFRHGPLTRDQCGSQDIGLHGTELEGLDCDTARFSMATIQQEWSVITPTVGDLVRITVSAVSNDKAYIAAISLRELGNDNALADMNNPAIAPLQPIETVSWDRLRQRMDYLYESRLRCVYSEANDTLLTQVTDGQTSTLAIIAYTTSPDMPFGAGILRFTVDAECIGAGTLTVSFTNTVTTVSLVFTARATLSGDLAVTSNTSYTLAIGGASSAPTADGQIYLMRIEEIYP